MKQYNNIVISNISMFKPSEEQKQISKYTQDGYNVIVNSVAGSGKSSTVITVAKDLPKKSFLHITFNSMLRLEFKEKLKTLNITNIDVHTYHSLAVKHYSKDAHTDSGLKKILFNNVIPFIPKKEIPKFDIVVLDEAQDMSILYYQFIRKFLQDIQGKKKIQIIVLGDNKQGLYEFKGSDIRFLTLAEEIWKDFGLLKMTEFKHCKLTMSYRITNQMSSFINNCMLEDSDTKIDACRNGDPVTYIRNTRFNIENIVFFHIKRILEEGDLPSDIFILGGSVKGTNSNIRKLENLLVENDIPCHIPMFETGTVDERIIDGKIVFSTFHSVKGRQRKYVFVMGFDNSYFSIYARTLDKNICPNTLYVGCTRATHKVFLLENNSHSTDRPLPFLKMNHYEMIATDYIDFKGLPQTIFYEKDPNSNSSNDIIKTHFVTPTELIKFLQEQVIEEVTPILDKIFISIQEPEIQDLNEIPSIVKFSNNNHEDISDLNGIAIPCIYWDYIQKKRGNAEKENALYSFIETQFNDINDYEHAYLKKIFRELKPICETPDDYLYMSNVYVAIQEKLYFKLKQIRRTEYNWLSQNVIDKCNQRLDFSITHNGTEDIESYENTIIHYKMIEEHKVIDSVLESYLGKDIKYRFNARVDLITKTTIWEVKCTTQLTMEHYLQVVIYAWLWKLLYKQEDKKVKIINVKTGQVKELCATMEELTFIMVALLKGKYINKEQMEDVEFIDKCKKNKC